MVRLPTWGWTEQHTYAAAAMGVAVTGALAALLDDGRYPFWVAAAVGATAVVSLAFDAFGGLLVGLAAAAAVVAVKKAGGVWAPPAFWPSLGQTAALLATGLASGAAGSHLRRRPRVVAGPVATGDPGYGPLGLVAPDHALARLEDEVERARRHRRPLTLIRVDVDVVDGDSETDALRAVARILESRVRDTDVPFAFAPDSLGAILPETDSVAAWDVVGPIVDAVGQATYASFSDGADGADGRRRLSDAVQLQVRLATLGVHGDSADELVEAATGSQPGADVVAP
jgi:GGDEF domain-containing protein